MNIGPALGIRQTRNLAMTAQLRQAIGLLQLNNAELHALLAREAAKNPALRVRAPQGAGASGGGGGTDGADRLAAPQGGLAQHVARQIGLTFRDPAQARIAAVFLDALEPYGWLGRDVADIAADCGVPEPEAEAVLHILQGLEPAGLFARSLAECLALQAREAGVLDPAMRAILGRLDLVASGDRAALAEVCGADADAVDARLALLRGFDPKPGARYAQDDAPLRPPDLFVTRDGDAWHVEFNASTLPGVDLREDLLTARDGREAFVAEALASARGLKQAIELRNANTLAVASDLVRRQAGYLSRQAAHPAPVTRKDVADALDLHESTVSRIVTGMLAETPRGVIELRALFCRGLPGAEDGGAVSVPQVQARIAAMIREEPAAAPLSDEAIAARLRDGEVTIRRRTVAKYRARMGIPGSSVRRRDGAAP